MKWLDNPRIFLFVLSSIMVFYLCDERAKADFTFGEPTLFSEPVNSNEIEYFDCISADGLEVYLDKPVSGGKTASDWDIYVSTRATLTDPWSVPMNLGPAVNSSGVVDGPASLSRNGLKLYFSSERSDGYGQQDIWVTTRNSKGFDWGTPLNLGFTINTSGRDWLPWVAPDGLELYFSSDRPGGYGGNDIWVTTRTTTNDEWGIPTNLGPAVNSTAGEFYPCLSPDGRVLFFSDFGHTNFGFRPGGYGWTDMWMSRRKSAADPWGPPVNLGPGVNTNGWDEVPRVSADGSVLYCTSNRPGGSFFWANNYDIWQAPIIPTVDFTGDYNVNIDDLVILIEHWGQEEPAYDMGPMPWGDGFVDRADLQVLMKYWEKEVHDPHLLAHWKLNESKGDVAYDSANDNDADVIGNASWQAISGQIEGAIQLDGDGSYLEAPYILNPADGVFSVFAWVKGGSPGKVILSQANGANWLMLDSQGNLQTTLKGGTRQKELSSGALLRDDAWNRVGFVWDGESRILHIGDVEVARDPHTVIDQSKGGMYIGAASGLEADTFWSGLIDDVRIYDRAVEP